MKQGIHPKYHEGEARCLTVWAFAVAHGRSLRRTLIRRRWARSTFYRRVEESSQRLADTRDDSVRDPARAVELAGRAVTLTNRRDPRWLDVLSVAPAGLGKYSDAAETAAEALVLARGQGNPVLVRELEFRERSYRQLSGKDPQD